MITVQKMYEAIAAFAAMQGVEIKEGEDKFSIRLFLPSAALTAIMADFNERPVSPKFKLDEDQQFYAKCKYLNVSLMINEGKTYKIENILGNQQMEKAMAGGDEILPGREPNIDHKK